MTRPRILQALRLLPSLESDLADRYDVDLLPPAGAERTAFLQQHGARYDAIVTSAAGGCDASLIDALPNLRVISSFGVGLDKIDVVAAARRGVPVGHTPGVLDDCVADTAFGLLIDVARRIGEADRYVRSGAWARQATTVPFGLGRKVSGARLGVVGMGRIGRTIAKRSTGFDMEVRYHSRRPVADLPWVHEPKLHDLARWCDFLVVITAGGSETRHLVDASVLDALGADGYLVNVSRGSVIDEAALLQALQDRRIAGAGLDVFDNEPRVPEAFFALDNCVLLPHIASATVQTRQAMGRRVVENLDGHFAGTGLVSAAPAG